MEREELDKELEWAKRDWKGPLNVRVKKDYSQIWADALWIVIGGVAAVAFWWGLWDPCKWGRHLSPGR